MDTEIKLKVQSHCEGHVLTDELPLKRKKEGYDDSSGLWLYVGDEKLYQTQKDILLDAEWLDDKIINSAQALLHKHFAMPGLQNTTLGYTYDVVCEPFVQMDKTTG